MDRISRIVVHEDWTAVHDEASRAASTQSDSNSSRAAAEFEHGDCSGVAVRAVARRGRDALIGKSRPADDHGVQYELDAGSVNRVVMVGDPLRHFHPGGNVKVSHCS